VSFFTRSKSVCCVLFSQSPERDDQCGSESNDDPLAEDVVGVVPTGQELEIKRRRVNCSQKSEEETASTLQSLKQVSRSLV
jgi:hypothetical protein